MKKTETTIEIEDSRTGKTTGPIKEGQFKEAVKKLALNPGREKSHGRGSKDDQPEYWRDPQLEEMGKELVQEIHEHLREAEFSYLLTSRPMNRAGKTLAGKARKVSGVLHYYTQSDFLIIVSNDFWQEAADTDRRALLDHELCHCSVEYDKEGGRQWTLKGHDIEEFIAIIDRRGLWHNELKQFGQAIAKQLELDFTQDDTEDAKETKVHETGASQGLP